MKTTYQLSSFLIQRNLAVSLLLFAALVLGACSENDSSNKDQAKLNGTAQGSESSCPEQFVCSLKTEGSDSGVEELDGGIASSSFALKSKSEATQAICSADGCEECTDGKCPTPTCEQSEDDSSMISSLEHGLAINSETFAIGSQNTRLVKKCQKWASKISDRTGRKMAMMACCGLYFGGCPAWGTFCGTLNQPMKQMCKAGCLPSCSARNCGFGR